MAELNTAKIIKKVRLSMEVSQEGLSRLLNATKGAIQHWERGRNRPDMARLLALRKLAPSGPERKELDALIKQTKAHLAPFTTSKDLPTLGRLPSSFPAGGMTLLRRDNARLTRQVAKLETALGRKTEKLRIVESLAADLQRELTNLKGK